MQRICAGLARFLFAPLAVVFISTTPAWAAKLAWKALPDRERITITLELSDGMAGAIDRIDSRGLVIPFTQVPPGLRVIETPATSRLFKLTRPRGTSLILETQTEKFGFIVTRQSRSEIIIDLFPDPLGERWKPTRKTPTSEMAPDEGLDPNRTAPAVVLPNTPPLAYPGAAPQQAPVQQVAQQPQQVVQQPTQAVQQPVAQQAAQQQPVVQQPAQQQPVMQLQAAQPPAQHAPPPVVALSGTPEHATTMTQMAQAPAPMATAPAEQAEELPTGPVPARPFPGAPMTSALGRDTQSGPDLTPPSIVTAVPAQTAQDSALGYAEPLNGGTYGGAVNMQPITANQMQQTQGMLPLPSDNQVYPPLPTTSQYAEQQPAQPAPVQEYVQPQVVQQPQPTQAVSQPPVAVQPQAVQEQPQGVPAQPAPAQNNFQPPAEVQPQATQAGSQPPAELQAQPAPAQGDFQPPAELQAQPEQAGFQPPAELQAPPVAVVPQQATPEAAAIVYTDADGNIVEPPADPIIVLDEIRNHVLSNDFATALPKIELLLSQKRITPEQQEELLHIRAEALFVLRRDNLQEYYKELSDATNQAINFNPKSLRNAHALLRLGYINLQINHIPEAEAFFTALRKQYPASDAVPLSYYYWGNHYYEKNELQKAADEFQYLLQEYPNSQHARNAALGLARTYDALGYYERAFSTLNFIEQRWPQFYVEYPPFLQLMGDVGFRLNKHDYALKRYWLYANMEPKGDKTDIILTRIGDIYSIRNEKEAAKTLYNEAISRFPGKEGALIAMVRLAEETVDDDPTIASMTDIFDAPINKESPEKTYKKILSEHPDSPIVPIVQVKLAMNYLLKNQFTAALDVCTEMLAKYPDHELAPRAKEVALQTFALMAAHSFSEGTQARILDAWEKYPIVREQENLLSHESRLLLATSYWQEGDPNKALETVDPFFLGTKVQKYSEEALTLVLKIYLENEQWESIKEVARRVELWELTDRIQQYLDYSVALAGESLGESQESAKIWTSLYESGKLPPAQMAYAVYFLARDAEQQRDLERAYTLGKDSLNRLMEKLEKSDSNADIGKIQSQLASLMDITERAGRLRESLEFANKYLQYLPENSPERIAVLYRTARIYRKQGNMDAWRKNLTELVTKHGQTVHGRTAASELKSDELAQEAAHYSPTGRL